MDYTEFTNTICNRYGSRRPFKVTNSWGVYDAYKHIRKNKWYNLERPLKEHEFYSIIRKINDHLAMNLANGDTVVFPWKMGKMEMRKLKRGVSLIDGKLKITYPIDWEETLRLWYEDEQARKDKTLMRNEIDYLYHIRYSKYNANYENQSFYEFVLNRNIKRMLKDNINAQKIDSIW